MGETGEQAAFWDERAAAWARHADAMEPFARQFGDPAMDLFAPSPGQHVADVGCGPGISTLELARRVGPTGSVTGVDVSAHMVAAAEERAAAAGVGNVVFAIADPGAGPLGSFDGIYSRFGLMFFDEPATAFENLRRSIRPGGRLVGVVWAELDANPWMFLPTMFAAEPLRAQLALPGPHEPGPFSLADPETTVALLESSGFGDVAVVRREHSWPIDPIAPGDSIARMLAVGPLGEAWTAAGDDDRRAAVDAVRGACEPFREDADWRLPAAALVVDASVVD